MKKKGTWPCLLYCHKKLSLDFENVFVCNVVIEKLMLLNKNKMRINIKHQQQQKKGIEKIGWLKFYFHEKW